jgi:hypothetical protein
MVYQPYYAVDSYVITITITITTTTIIIIVALILSWNINHIMQWIFTSSSSSQPA